MKKFVILIVVIIAFCDSGCGNSTSIFQSKYDYLIEHSSEIIFNKEELDDLSQNDLWGIQSYLNEKIHDNSELEFGNKKDILTFEDYIDTWILYDLTSYYPYYDQLLAKCEIKKIDSDEYNKILPYAEQNKRTKWRFDVNGFSNDIFKLEMTIFCPYIDGFDISEEERKYVKSFEDGSCEVSIVGYYIGVSYTDRIALEPIGAISGNEDNTINITMFDNNSPIIGENYSKRYYGYAILLNKTCNENVYSELKRHMRERYNLEYLNMFIKYQKDHGINTPDETPLSNDKLISENLPSPPVLPEPPIPEVSYENNNITQNASDEVKITQAVWDFLFRVSQREYNEAYEYLTVDYQKRLQSPKSLEEKFEDTYLNGIPNVDDIEINSNNSREAYCNVKVSRYYFHDYNLLGKTSIHRVKVKKINDKWLLDSISPEMMANP